MFLFPTDLRGPRGSKKEATVSLPTSSQESLLAFVFRWSHRAQEGTPQGHEYCEAGLTEAILEAGSPTTEGLSFEFYFHLDLTGHVWLVATILDSTALEDRLQRETRANTYDAVRWWRMPERKTQPGWGGELLFSWRSLGSASFEEVTQSRPEGSEW